MMIVSTMLATGTVIVIFACIITTLFPQVPLWVPILIGAIIMFFVLLWLENG